MATTGGSERKGSERTPRVERLSLELLEWCHRAGGVLYRRRPGMNDQLQRAADSVLANIGEAFDEENSGDQRRFFRYALRSAGEAERLLRGAVGLDLLRSADTEVALRLLKNIKMDIRRLIKWAS